MPTINGVYVVLDAETLRPVAVLDGTALTTLRTPAVSGRPRDGPWSSASRIALKRHGGVTVQVIISS